MGHEVPVEEPEEVAGDCECFEAGETPLYINAVFTGITKCFEEDPDPPNGHVFKLKQKPGAYCFFEGTDTVGGVDWTAIWDFVAGSAPRVTWIRLLWGTPISGVAYFAYGAAPECDAGPVNNALGPDWCGGYYRGHGGQGEVSYEQRRI